VIALSLRFGLRSMYFLPDFFADRHERATSKSESGGKSHILDPQNAFPRLAARASRSSVTLRAYRPRASGFTEFSSASPPSKA
jgi:hypothetical protein